MEGKNDLKIDLYPDKEPRYSFDKQSIKDSDYYSTMNSLKGIDSLAYVQSNVPVLNGFYKAHCNHYPIRIKPDDIWLLIIQSFSHHIDDNAEKLRHMFVDFDGKKTISIDYNISDINDLNTKILEDFSIKINDKLKEVLGEKILDILTPNFSTTTNDSLIVCKITIMSAFKKFFTYEMRLCGCGIPYIILEGTAEDYNKIILKANELRKYDFDWYIEQIIPHLQKMKEAKEGKIDIDYFKSMIQKKEIIESIIKPSGMEPEDVKFDYLSGWFLKFFAYYARNQRCKRFFRFNGDKIKVIDFRKLANQMLKAPFVVKDKIHNKEYNLEYRVGFFGCDQNEKKEIFPVMGWSVGQFHEEEENYY